MGGLRQLPRERSLGGIELRRIRAIRIRRFRPYHRRIFGGLLIDVTTNMGFDRHARSEIEAGCRVHATNDMFRFTNFTIATFRRLFQFINHFPLMARVRRIRRRIVTRCTGTIDRSTIFTTVRINARCTRPTRRHDRFQHNRNRLLNFISRR